MGARRRARECALQLLYQYDLTHDPPDEILRRYWEMSPGQAAQVQEMAGRLFLASLERREEIDGLIRGQSHHWQLDRMSSVDRNLLRMSVGELMLGEESQAAVIINEALEIAKRFSGEDSSRFINGVLDGIHQNLKARQQTSAPARGARKPAPEAKE